MVADEAKTKPRRNDDGEIQDRADDGRSEHRPGSRANRLAEAESTVDDVKTTVEELKDELQQWLDGLPENLQSGSKADELNEAIQELETIQEALEGLDFSSVSFPSMMG